MVHPQIAIHELSLLASAEKGGLHTPPSSAEAGIEQMGSKTANTYWLNAARQIDWIKPPTVAYGLVNGEARPSWFPGATMNTCYNALDRHVLAGFGERTAFHHYSPLPAAAAQASRSMTYEELLWEVQVLAGVLRHKFGVQKGDRVVIYFPMILQCAVAMLACARIGAIHSVVFGGFASKELAKRIEDAQPKVIISASCGLEPKGIIDYKPLIDAALGFSTHKCPLLMLRRTKIKGHTVPKLVAARKEFDYEVECDKVRRSRKRALLVETCVEVGANDPLYILYTSGTTGMPKGVVRNNGGHAVGSRATIQYTYGLSRDDTIFCASDFGWVVGHSFCLYSPLLLGCTSVIFEGKPVLPDAGVFWKVVEKYQVSCLYTAPTALRAIRREDPDALLMSSYNLRSLRSLFLAGERSEPAIVSRYQVLLDQLGARGAIVNDNYWSTESGSPISGVQLNKAFPPLAPRPGAAGLPLPGMDVRIVDDEGIEVEKGTMGNIVLAQPLPPTALATVWHNDARYHEAYFSRFERKGDWFDTGDAGVLDLDGYISVLSRADDLINTAGHRLGTSLIEQVVASHPYVAECCVVGLPDEIKGHVPFAIIIRALSPEAQSANLATLLSAVNDQVRTDVGAIATLGGLVCARLPKTRSGKTLRRTVKVLVENASKGDWDKEAPFPPTIEDVTAVDDARFHINEYFKSPVGKLAGKAKAKL